MYLDDNDDDAWTHTTETAINLTSPLLPPLACSEVHAVLAVLLFPHLASFKTSLEDFWINSGVTRVSKEGKLARRA